VDNLFRREGDRSVQVTNTLTGIWLPSFGPSGLYASHYSNDGWDLARLTLSKTGYDSTALTIQGAPAPHPAPGEVVEKAFETHSSRDYSAFPSIWPRQWAPLLYGTSDGRLAFGGEVFGFDAVDRHRYLLGVLYDPQIRRPDWVLYYSNRQLGPSINLFTSGNQYLPVDSPGFLKEELKATVSADFPIRFTYSTLTPSARFNTERNAYVRDNGQGDVFSSSLEPSFDARLHYADAESSRLAITAEEGRSTELSARRYLRPGSEGYKAVLSESEYFRITDHSILNPRLRGSVSDRRFRGVNSSNVQVRGLSTGVFAGTPDLLDELPLRGYPGVTFQTRAAFTGSMDFRFPLWRIFRGWGTNPLFLENLSGFVFGESAYFPNAILGEHFVPSAGAGARLDLTALILVPVSATVEYQKGFREQFDGTGEVVFKLGLTGLPF